MRLLPHHPLCDAVPITPAPFSVCACVFVRALECAQGVCLCTHLNNNLNSHMFSGAGLHALLLGLPKGQFCGCGCRCYARCEALLIRAVLRLRVVACALPSPEGCIHPSVIRVVDLYVLFAGHVRTSCSLG